MSNRLTIGRSSLFGSAQHQPNWNRCAGKGCWACGVGARKVVRRLVWFASTRCRAVRVGVSLYRRARLLVERCRGEEERCPKNSGDRLAALPGGWWLAATIGRRYDSGQKSNRMRLGWRPCCGVEAIGLDYTGAGQGGWSSKSFHTIAKAAPGVGSRLNRIPLLAVYN